MCFSFHTLFVHVFVTVHFTSFLLVAFINTGTLPSVLLVLPILLRLVQFSSTVKIFPTAVCTAYSIRSIGQMTRITSSIRPIIRPLQASGNFPSLLTFWKVPVVRIDLKLP